MDKHPVPPRRRRLYEALIRAVDLVVYAAVFAGGCYAMFATPSTVVDELGDADWLIVFWSIMLLAGGSVGFAGRAFRRWMVETPATVASFTGILVYVIVLGRYAFTSITAAVAVALTVVAALTMARRWLELQIFATEPGLNLRGRFLAALGRRTANTVPRDQ